MGNVNMPTPVALAGGALCLLAGYLVGTLLGCVAVTAAAVILTRSVAAGTRP